MKRFTSSVLSASAFSLLLLAGAIAPSAQALPKIDSDFKLQSLRLDEMDARDKANYDPSIDSLQTTEFAEPTAAEPTAAEPTAAESTSWERAEAEKETSSPALSITERRQQSLDRRS